ncbi:MAG: 16S rRNA (adenine(1518)-N(6)/adenine(1519)-N(6))-dimethyltransferase RsmA [Clostridia bacterium]|nr:16S rRNA (adenine(1518)-N(6)/adenine(1519)-N(6))-dimethyltransferase RsmA [Clostridia bacterium]
MADFRAKKALGQNFINDPQIIEAIVDACGAGPDDIVVEIGPGKGALTCTLAERAKRVIAVELDSSVIPLLKGNLAGASNVEVVNEDILKFDWSRATGGLSVTENQCNSEPHCNSGVLRIVGNLPYYITTPILLGILEKNVPAKSITVMVQKEVAERICAGPGGKDYGVLSISLQYYADCSYVLDVPAEFFTPRPKVDSAVVHMTLKKERLLAPEGEPQFFALVKKAFSQRRKTLVNSLVGYCPASGAAPLQKEDILKALAACGIDEKRRPETLSIEEFAALSRAFQCS